MILRKEEEDMVKGKHSEAEIIGALKQLEAGPPSSKTATATASASSVACRQHGPLGGTLICWDHL